VACEGEVGVADAMGGVVEEGVLEVSEGVLKLEQTVAGVEAGVVGGVFEGAAAEEKGVEAEDEGVGTSEGEEEVRGDWEKQTGLNSMRN